MIDDRCVSPEAEEFAEGTGMDSEVIQFMYDVLMDDV